MSDAARARVLAEALAEIPLSGISEATLAKAAVRAGVKDELKRAFPKGAESLMEAFSHWADAHMREAMENDPSQRVSERVKHAVQARIEALVPYRAAARKAAAFLSLPHHAALAARLMLTSVDAMWRAAGDRSSDFSYYTKRATLSAVYGATFVYWLSDAGENLDAVWAFLDHRIENAMGIGKLTHKAREMAAAFPDPFGFFKTPRGRA